MILLWVRTDTWVLLPIFLEMIQCVGLNIPLTGKGNYNSIGNEEGKNEDLPEGGWE